MSVYIPIPVNDVEFEQESPSLTYRLDLDKGRIVGRTDGLEAVNQAIRKALITPRFKCIVYDNQYGSEIKSTVIADDVTPEYIESIMPKLVEDVLLADSRILEISDFTFSFEGEVAYIEFKASTVFGDINIEEAI